VCDPSRSLHDIVFQVICGWENLVAELNWTYCDMCSPTLPVAAGAGG
jgi:hypothetical protein